MSRKSSLTNAILLLITYVIGLPLFIIGIMSNGEKILFTLIGLLICGLPTACVALFTAKTLFTKKSLKGRRFAVFFMGLLFGFVTTPICIIYLFIQASKEKSKKDVEIEDTSKTTNEIKQDNINEN